MLRRAVAEQDRRALSPGDRLAAIACARRRRRRCRRARPATATPRACGRGDDDLGERAPASRRRHDQLLRDRHQRVVVDRVQDRQLARPSSRPGAGACASSGWSLRRKQPIDEHAVELAELGDRHAEPRRAVAPPSARKSVWRRRKSMLSAAERRARASAAGAALRASSAARPARRSRRRRARRDVASGRARRIRARSASRLRATRRPA